MPASAPIVNGTKRIKQCPFRKILGMKANSGVKGNNSAKLESHRSGLINGSVGIGRNATRNSGQTGGKVWQA